MPDVLDTILARVTLDENDCWLMKTNEPTGYGKVWHEGKNAYAHRITYELFRAPIPTGLTIDHLCHVRNCVNPWHLELVTMRENLLRGEGPTAANARRTQCSRGHEFNEANTGVRKTGQRYCRACHREQYHERKAALAKLAEMEAGEMPRLCYHATGYECPPCGIR